MDQTLSPGWEDYMGSALGRFMGGPFIEYAQKIRAGATDRVAP
jgi:hypothetical protein